MLAPTVRETNFKLPGQKDLYKGKVRDVYNINDKYMVVVVTDRISAFDIVLEKPIPFKGQVLNQIAAYHLQATGQLVPNWVLSVPDPNVTIGLKCQPFKLEVVIRAYLSGHAWREYTMGKRLLCGIELPDGLNENDKFPAPIVTPTTKVAVGHDEDISKEQAIAMRLVSLKQYSVLENYAQKLFKKGTELAEQRGLILVDTKYEFGEKDDQIYLIDEIHTPDSSRYWYSKDYEERQTKNEPQRQLSKEFLREWLIENNFQGQLGQPVPLIDDGLVQRVSHRYKELYEQLTGEQFIKPDQTVSIEARIEANILKGLEQLGAK